MGRLAHRVRQINGEDKKEHIALGETVAGAVKGNTDSLRDEIGTDVRRHTEFLSNNLHTIGNDLSNQVSGVSPPIANMIQASHDMLLGQIEKIAKKQAELSKKQEKLSAESEKASVERFKALNSKKIPKTDLKPLEIRINDLNDQVIVASNDMVNAIVAVNLRIDGMETEISRPHKSREFDFALTRDPFTQDLTKIVATERNQ